MDERTDDEKKFDERLQNLSNYVDKLGVPQLARDIDDERFLHKILDGQVFLNSLSIQKVIEKQQNEELYDRLFQFQTQLFDKAATYNNILVTLGYAGFFAIWGFANESLHIFDRNLIAVLLGLSLMIYIVWTLLLSWKSSTNSRQTFQIYVENDGDGEKLAKDLTQLESKQRKSLAGFLIWYPKVFILTTALGFFAGFYLLIILGFQLFGINFSLETLIQYVKQP